MEEADKEGLGNITYKDFLALCNPLSDSRLMKTYKFISLNSFLLLKIQNILGVLKVK